VSSSHPGNIKLFPRRVRVHLQPDRGRTHLATIQRRVLNPSAKRLIMSQRLPNTETKVSGVCIHETRSDASIAAMTMNQCQFVFTHLPSLLHNFPKSSVEHDFGRMIPVKVNFHFFAPNPLHSEPTGCCYRIEDSDQRGPYFGISHNPDGLEGRVIPIFDGSL